MRRALAAAALFLVACSGDDGGSSAPTTAAAPATTTTVAATPARFPGEAWEHISAEAAGMDAAVLDRLVADAEAARSDCLVVVRDGAVVVEEYWGDGGPESPREAFSVTKSVTSTLVGIAEAEGALDIDDSASVYIPAWAGTPAEAVTIRNLLSNDSGREWSLGIDYGQLLGAEDKNAFAIGLAQAAEPGTVWAYNNSAIQTLSAVLADATAEPVDEFAESRLFDPIGMEQSSMSTDGAGNVLTFMGLRTTCLDLARFGLLALHDGEWDGEQVVPAAYLEEATGRSSTELNAGYGFLWWLNHEGQLVSPLVSTQAVESPDITFGRMVPEAPEDTFWALGFRNQIVAVMPSAGVVAVRMGAGPPPEAPFSQAELTRALVEALAPAAAGVGG